MWVRKSKQRLAEQPKRRKYLLSFGGPAFMFFIFSALAMVGIFIGGDPPRSTSYKALTLHDVLLIATIFGLILAIASYVLQIIFKKEFVDVVYDSALFSGAKDMMCNNCYQAKKNDGNYQCECGGKYEDIENWEWIDEQYDDAEENLTADGRRNTDH